MDNPIMLPPLPAEQGDRILNAAHRAFERDYGVCWEHQLRDCTACAG